VNVSTAANLTCGSLRRSVIEGHMDDRHRIEQA